MPLSVSSVFKRPRQSYSKSFKAELVAACQQPGASVAAIAMANQLNANLLRRWIKLHVARQAVQTSGSKALVKPAPALGPVAVQPEAEVAVGDFRCEIRHRQAVIQVTWPVDQASACAQWLRELLQ